MSRCESCLGKEVCFLALDDCNFYLPFEDFLQKDLMEEADKYAASLFSRLAEKIKEVSMANEKKEKLSDAMGDLFELVDDSGLLQAEEDEDIRPEEGGDGDSNKEEKFKEEVEEKGKETVKKVEEEKTQEDEAAVSNVVVQEGGANDGPETKKVSIEVGQLFPNYELRYNLTVTMASKSLLYDFLAKLSTNNPFITSDDLAVIERTVFEVLERYAS